MKTPYKFLPLISPTYRTIRKVYQSFKYAGQEVNCPICDRNFSSWLRQQENGTCPSCDSKTRHRLLSLFLKKHSRIFDQPCRILHFAPDQCLRAKFQNRHNLEYTTADLSAPGVDVHTDLTNLIFDDNSFDAIFCSHVLEHIPNDRAAMSQMYRVLSPNGIAYIQVPYNRYEKSDEDPNVTDPVEREKRFGQFDHLRVYGVDLKERLESVGFQVKEEYYARQLDKSDRQRYGVWDDIIFCCTKLDRNNTTDI